MLKKLAKRLASVVAAVTMAVTFTGGVGSSIPVYAEGNGEITISGAVEGKTYSAYKLFDLVSYDKTANAYLYTVDDDFSTFFSTGAGKTYVTINDQSYVTAVSDAAALAAAARTYIETVNSDSDNTNDITADGTATGAASGTDTKISNLPLGYYLVTTTQGALASLGTTDTSVTITEKNGTPTVDKTVQEDSKVTGADASEGDGKTGYQKKNDADIGQTVYYKTVITVQPGATNYVLNDTATGLTFDTATDETSKAHKFIDGITYTDSNGDSQSFTEGESNDYTVTQSSSTDSNSVVTSTFTITFADASVAKVPVDTDSIKSEYNKITVLYHATVDSTAVIAGSGNPNETYLSYGESNNSAHSITKTYVWKINVYKYYKNDKSENTLLAGAKFKLFNSDQSKVATVENDKITGFADVTKDEDSGAVTNGTELETNSDGIISISGLDADDYVLVETEAPDGFAKLTEGINVKITSTTNYDNADASSDSSNNKTYTVTYKKVSAAEYTNASNNTTDNYANQVNVENTRISLLPTTGGAGRFIYILLTKRLSGTNRFQWPRNAEDLKQITLQQYNNLMEGFTIEGSIKQVMPSK